jgi:hypothetical protein
MKSNDRASGKRFLQLGILKYLHLQGRGGSDQLFYRWGNFDLCFDLVNAGG